MKTHEAGRITWRLGQQVGYYGTGSMGRIHSDGIGTVTKINGYGHISIENENGDTKVFDKHGDERKKYSGARLCDVEYIEEWRIEDHKRRATYKAVKTLTEGLAGKKDGTGRYHLTNEALVLIDQLNSELSKAST